MYSQLSPITERVNKSKLKDDLKVWLINELAQQPKTQEYAIVYMYESGEKSDFHQTSIADITKYYSTSIATIEGIDLAKVSPDVRTLILCSPSESIVSEINLKAQSNPCYEMVMIVGDYEEKYKEGGKVNFFNTKNRSIKSLFRKMNIEHVLSEKSNSNVDFIKSKIGLIHNRIDMYNTELRAKIYEIKQVELDVGEKTAKTSGRARDIKSKLKLQENIFKKNLERNLEQYFGENSTFARELECKVNEIEELAENIKTKKNELSIPGEIIEVIKSRFHNNSKLFWEDMLENLNRYFDRNSIYIQDNLKQNAFNQSLRTKENKETNLYQNFNEQSVNTKLNKITSEIAKKRVGDYLMRARMFPMYILMGSSMLGLSITRGSGAKFMAPIMIFLMGLGFFMIYNSRQKEEKDEKDKALASIKEKTLSEISKRCKDFIGYAKKYFESQIKSNDEDLISFYEKTISLKSVDNNQKSSFNKSSSKLNDLENQLRDTNDVKKELNKVLDRIK